MMVSKSQFPPRIESRKYSLAFHDVAKKYESITSSTLANMEWVNKTIGQVDQLLIDLSGG